MHKAKTKIIVTNDKCILCFWTIKKYNLIFKILISINLIIVLSISVNRLF